MPGGLKSLAPEGARPPQGRGRQLRRPLWKLGGTSGAAGSSTPIRRIRWAFCARAASGHDAAAPPITVMNSRRFIQLSRRRGRRGAAGQ
jgi:hypothetical protein